MKGRGHRVRGWADASRRAVGCDPPELLRAHRGASTAQQAHRSVRRHAQRRSPSRLTRGSPCDNVSRKASSAMRALIGGAGSGRSAGLRPPAARWGRACAVPWPCAWPCDPWRLHWQRSVNGDRCPVTHPATEWHSGSTESLNPVGRPPSRWCSVDRVTSLLRTLTTGNGPQSYLNLSGRRLLARVTACITVGVRRRLQLVVGRLFQGDQGVVSFR